MDVNSKRSKRYEGNSGDFKQVFGGIRDEFERRNVLKSSINISMPYFPFQMAGYLCTPLLNDRMDDLVLLECATNRLCEEEHLNLCVP